MPFESFQTEYSMSHGVILRIHLPANDVEEVDLGLQEDGLRDDEALLGEAPVTIAELPKVFVSLKTWPATTNLLCWSCHGQISGPPKFVAEGTVPQPDSSSLGLLRHGAMCTFVCVQRYLITNARFARNLNYYQELLHHEVLAFTGCVVTRIPTAPSILDTREYSGSTFDMRAFRAEIKALEQQFLAAKPPLTHSSVLPAFGPAPAGLSMWELADAKQPVPPPPAIAIPSAAPAPSSAAPAPSSAASALPRAAPPAPESDAAKPAIESIDELLGFSLVDSDDESDHCAAPGEVAAPEAEGALDAGADELADLEVLLVDD